MYRHSVLISQDAIDANGHANNVEYLRWMQDAAVGHADATGCTVVTRKVGASWVVRSHQIEYLQPAFAGDRLVVCTWVSNLRKASSLRKYLLLRETDHAVIAVKLTGYS
jgi:acyl-CoA thioester hydrolase